jgi:hypothetical protein
MAFNWNTAKQATAWICGATVAVGGSILSFLPGQWHTVDGAIVAAAGALGAYCGLSSTKLTMFGGKADPS